MDSNSFSDLKRSFLSEEDPNRKAIIGENIWQHYYAMGSQSLDNKAYNCAIKYHIRALEYNEYVGREAISALFLAIGVAYEKLEDYANAICYYKKILDIDDLDILDKVTAIEFIGQSYEKSGKYNEAIKFYKKRFTLSPPKKDDWYLTYRLAYIAYQTQDYELAKKYYKITLNIIPNNNDKYRQRTMQNMAYSYQHLGRTRQAIKYFKKAIEKKSSIKNIKSELYCGLAGAYFDISRYNKVIKYAITAIQNPYDGDTLERCLFLLAFSFRAIGNEDKSQDYSKQLLTLNPKSRFFNDLL